MGRREEGRSGGMGRRAIKRKAVAKELVRQEQVEEERVKKRLDVLPVSLVWVNVNLMAGTGIDTEDINHLRPGRGRKGQIFLTWVSCYGQPSSG